jgi:hypothetical protein
MTEDGGLIAKTMNPLNTRSSEPRTLNPEPMNLDHQSVNKKYNCSFIIAVGFTIRSYRKELLWQRLLKLT